MAMFEGEVLAVRKHFTGTELAADASAGATTIFVVDPNELDLDGGLVNLASDAAAGYTVVDEDTGELELDTPLSTGYSEGAAVLFASPLGIERYADVLGPEQDETLEVLIPIGLFDKSLPLGTRGDDDREWLWYERRGEQLVATHVEGRSPTIDGQFLNAGTVVAEALSEVIADQTGLSGRSGFAQVETAEGGTDLNQDDLATPGPSTEVVVPANALLAVYAEVDINLIDADDATVHVVEDGGPGILHNIFWDWDLGDYTTICTRPHRFGEPVGEITAAQPGMGTWIIYRPSAGMHTYEFKYSCTGGEARFRNRRLWVRALAIEA
jgi:hypothetical protein